MIRIFLGLWLYFPVVAFSQYPDAAILKKLKVKRITEESEGRERIFFYDNEGFEYGHIDKSYPNLGYERKIYYNASKRPDSIRIIYQNKDRTGKITYRYKADGSYTRITSSCIKIDKVDYCGTDSALIGRFNKIQWEVAHNGGKTTFEYDAKGNLVKSVDEKNGIVTRYTYNPSGKVEMCKATNSNGTSTTTFSYGANNLLVKEVYISEGIQFTKNYTYQYY